MSAEQKRNIHQRDLALRIQRNGLRKFADNNEIEDKKTTIARKFESYKKETNMPVEIKLLKVSIIFKPRL